METELSGRIAQSRFAKRALGTVSPIYGGAYLALWLYEAMGREMDTLEGWVEEFEQQLVPQTATWGLHCWEQAYGIPTDESLSDQDRRSALLSRIQTRAPMSPARMEEILSRSTGRAVEIVENTAPYTFLVIVHGWLEKTRTVWDLVRRCKPAHLSFVMKQIERRENPIRLITCGRAGIRLKTSPYAAERQMAAVWAEQAAYVRTGIKMRVYAREESEWQSIIQW